MNEYTDRLALTDCGGRRLSGERRLFDYSVHIPERRNGKDRRSGKEHRQIPLGDLKVIDDL